MKTLLNIILALFISITCFSQISNCKDCNTRLLNEEDIFGKSLEELALLRNEIFARNGYVFENYIYDRYFSNQNWYSPAQSNSQVKLSDIETKNVNFLKKEEDRLRNIRKACIRDLKEMKQGLNKGSEDIIDKYLKRIKEEEVNFSEDIIESLRSILNKVDIDNIGWNKGRGKYSLSIDNGYSISEYGIDIKDDMITVWKSDPMSHSSIFGDFDDGYSGYMSEAENSIFFNFKMTETGIEYDNMQAAG